MRRRLLLLAAAVVSAGTASAYTFTSSRWTTSTITMQLQLGPTSGTLSDGSASWGASAEDALTTWNNYIGSTRFTVVRNSTAPIAQGNRTNNVLFGSTIYGDAWGTGVLAITLTYSSGAGQTTETDVLFNSNLGWDSYRGAQHYGSTGTLYDFHRVALHEFGHVLGLDHPDQAGQSVVAIMNSRITNLDALAADDIAGAQALYGANSSIPVASAPVITSQPPSRTVNQGDSATFSVTVTGTAPMSYAWRKDGTPVSGATQSSYTISSVTARDAGSYSVVVANRAGSITSSAAVLTVNTPPVLTNLPSNQTVAAGNRVVLSVTAAGTPTATYQWLKNGSTIAGATNASLVFASAAPTDSGTYSVVVANSAGYVTTVPVLLTVTYSQLVNLSTRGVVPPGAALTAGFVIRGVAAKPIIVRGIGPALSDFGVSGALSNPQLAVIAQDSSQTIAVNNDWGSVPQLSTAFQTVGAFALPAGSADSASEVRLAPGAYTTRITATGGASGVALAEVYDADSTAPGTRLVNLSTLGFTGSGDQTLVGGFSISGNVPKRVLIRAIGPGLAAYAVSGAITNPKLDVFRLGETTAIATNDDWAGTAELQAAFSAAGAFDLAPGSRDAAVVLTLPAGGYTATVSGVAGATGNVLVEVYDLDP